MFATAVLVGTMRVCLVRTLLNNSTHKNRLAQKVSALIAYPNYCTWTTASDVRSNVVKEGFQRKKFVFKFLVICKMPVHCDSTIGKMIYHPW